MIRHGDCLEVMAGMEPDSIDAVKMGSVRTMFAGQQRENDALVGYLIFGNDWRITKVYQAVVDYSARRREHGLALVSKLVAQAKRRGTQGIALWCADDLDANGFWRAAGFSFAGTRRLANKRGRSHNRWVLLFKDQPMLPWGG